MKCGVQLQIANLSERENSIQKYFRNTCRHGISYSLLAAFNSFSSFEQGQSIFSAIRQLRERDYKTRCMLRFFLFCLIFKDNNVYSLHGKKFEHAIHIQDYIRMEKNALPIDNFARRQCVSVCSYVCVVIIYLSMNACIRPTAVRPNDVDDNTVPGFLSSYQKNSFTKGVACVVVPHIINVARGGLCAKLQRFATLAVKCRDVTVAVRYAPIIENRKSGLFSEMIMITNCV